MELLFIIVGTLLALILVFKLVKGVVSLVLKIAIIGIALWALSYFRPDIFG